MPDRTVSRKRIHEAGFSAFGVKFSLRSPDRELLEEAKQSLVAFFPSRLASADVELCTEKFEFESSRGIMRLESSFGNTEMADSRLDFLRLLRSLVRATVASQAKRHVFLHAGVVGIRGRALVIPADSRAGKTSLVRALIERGAEYYSDEYAVIDSKGLVRPFAKALSVRGLSGDPYVSEDLEPTGIGAVSGKSAVPLGWVLFTHYRKGAHWNPRRLSQGEGRLLTIPHVIGLANRPEMGLKYLENALKNAEILASVRGDAARTAEKLLQTLEK